MEAVARATAVERQGLVQTMARIRRFEMNLLDLFARGKISGTTHTCVGQEACAVALYAHIDRERDAVFTNHRCHGHFLAYGGSMRALLAEILGKRGGVCHGRGGSQHLCEGAFFSQGIQGGGLPLAAGYALRQKAQGQGGIVVSHIGDGTLGEGAVYEALNLIALNALPVLIVLEHNGVAQSTDTARTTAGDIEARFAAFGVETDRRRADDPHALAEHLSEVVARVRQGRPHVQILDTFRLMAHSKGDDDRPEAVLKEAWRNDYLAALIEREDPEALAAWQSSGEEIEALNVELEALDWEDLGTSPVLAEPADRLFASSSELVFPAEGEAAGLRINEWLNRALRQMLADDSDIVVIGEDLLDPYGGAFKVAKGLSTAHADQVISSPISEAGIVGMGTGYAMAGGTAVVEIMFGDFTLLAADQLVNQAAKMHFMYDGKIRVPTTVRMVSGGYRGYGPTHSQSLESRFCGVPGLKVVSLSRRHHAEALLTAVVQRDPNPVVFVEQKMLYSMRPHAGAPTGFRFVPVPSAAVADYPPLAFTSAESGRPADATVVTYGGLTDMAEAAMLELTVEEELSFDYFVLTQLSPLRADAVIESVRTTGRLIVVEEGPRSFGVGAEVVAAVVAALGGQGVQVARVGADDMPIPSARRLEDDALPSRGRIAAAILGLF